jgi:hypothetical protein
MFALMASHPRPSTPLAPSTPDSLSNDHPGLEDWLRIIAEDMDAMCALALAVDQYKAQTATTPQPRIRSRVRTES